MIPKDYPQYGAAHLDIAWIPYFQFEFRWKWMDMIRYGYSYGIYLDFWPRKSPIKEGEYIFKYSWKWEWKFISYESLYKKAHRIQEKPNLILVNENFSEKMRKIKILERKLEQCGVPMFQPRPSEHPSVENKGD